MFPGRVSYGALSRRATPTHARVARIEALVPGPSPCNLAGRRATDSPRGACGRDADVYHQVIGDSLELRLELVERDRWRTG